MKRFFIFLSTVLILGTLSIVLTTPVHAQTTTTTSTVPQCINILGSNVAPTASLTGTCQSKDASGNPETCTISGLSASCTATVNGAAVTTTQTSANLLQGQTQGTATTCTNGTNCSTQTLLQKAASDTTTGIIGGITNTIAQLLYSFLTILGFLLGKIGLLFNWAIVITVFQFGLYFANSGGMLTAWGVLRDIGNIVILFGFIFIGVMMILDLHSFDARRTLPRLVIFAVLLNFSLFAGEAVVDVANALSAQIYNQAGQGTSTSSGTPTTGTGTAAQGTASPNSTNLGIAGIIFQDTGIAGTFAWKPQADTTSSTNQMVTYMGVIILIVVTMMVLLAGAIMLFTRAVMLSFLLIISPLAFAAMAIPQFEERAMEWWRKLLSNAFFAPVYLLLIFVGIKVMEASKTALGTGTGGKAATIIDALQANGTDSTTVLILFAMMIAFMIAALLFARSSGAAGAVFATNFAQSAIQRTVINPARRLAMVPINATTTGAKIGARTVAGGAATQFARNYDTTIGKWRTSNNLLAKGTALTLRGLGADEAIENAAKNVQNAKFGTNRSFKEDKEHSKHRTDHLNHAAHLADQIIVGNAGLTATATDAQKEAAAQAFVQMTESDRNQFASRLKGDELKNFSALLTPETFSKMANNKDLSGLQHDLVEGRLKDAKAKFAAFNEKTGEEKKQALKDLKGAAAFSKEELKVILEQDKDFATQLLNVEDEKGNGILDGKAVDGIIDDNSVLKSSRRLVGETQKKGKKLNKLLGDYEEPNSDRTALAAKIGTIMSSNNLKKEAADVGEDKIYEYSSTLGQRGKLTEAGKIYVSHLQSTDMAAIMAKGEIGDEAKTAILDHLNSTVTEPTRRARLNSYLKSPNNAAYWGRNSL